MPTTFVFSSEADLDGTSRRDLARRCSKGELVRLRRGVYILASSGGASLPGSANE